MTQSLTPKLVSTQTGGGRVISYFATVGQSQTPPNMSVKANTNYTMVYRP